MSRGLPVVATNVGGMSELVNNNYLFSPGNFRDLANLIKDLIGEPNEYEVQSKQSLLVSARFIDDLLASQREEFYYEFLRPML
jgi:glycosyltransferase involved in cell wall biosynthesis